MPDITLTRAQWILIREALAGAQIFVQRVNPAIKKAHVTFDKETRRIMPEAQRAIGSGFNLARELTAQTDPENLLATAAPANPQPEVDTKAMLEELDACFTLVLPDIEHQMVRAIGTCPMVALLTHPLEPHYHTTARVMTASWEAGRRYGITEAIALLDATNDEYINSMDSILTAALNRNLDVELAPSQAQSGEEPQPRPELTIVEAPITDEGSDQGGNSSAPLHTPRTIQ